MNSSRVAVSARINKVETRQATEINAGIPRRRNYRRLVDCDEIDVREALTNAATIYLPPHPPQIAK